MKRTPLAAAAALLAVSVAAVGCGEDDPEPTFAPTAESSATASPSPKGSASPTPRKLSPEETVRAWVKARNVTVQDGSTEEVYALSTPDCQTCRDSVEPVAQVYRDGGRYETSGWRVEEVKRTPEFSNSHEVAVAVEYGAGRTIRKEGAEPVVYDAEKQLFLFELKKDEETWLVKQILYVS